MSFGRFVMFIRTKLVGKLVFLAVNIIFLVRTILFYFRSFYYYPFLNTNTEQEFLNNIKKKKIIYLAQYTKF
jgi:hypothetical protein